MTVLHTRSRVVGSAVQISKLAKALHLEIAAALPVGVAAILRIAVQDGKWKILCPIIKVHWGYLVH